MRAGKHVVIVNKRLYSQQLENDFRCVPQLSIILYFVIPVLMRLPCFE
jgi:hypothetical protein